MSKKPASDAAEEAAAGRKKTMVIAVVALLAIGAAAYFFLFAGGDDHGEPVAGEVLPLEAVAVNLAGGGYLKVGIALQLTQHASHGGGHGGGPSVDGSKALDLVISTYSQAQPADVAGARDALKEALEQRIIEAYTDGEGLPMVMDIYFTEYVTQ